MIEKLNEILKTNKLTEQENVFAQMFKDQHELLIQCIMKSPLFLIPVNGMGAGGVLFSFLESIEWMRFEKLNDFKILLWRYIIIL